MSMRCYGAQGCSWVAGHGSMSDGGSRPAELLPAEVALAVAVRGHGGAWRRGQRWLCRAMAAPPFSPFFLLCRAKPCGGGHVQRGWRHAVAAMFGEGGAMWWQPCSGRRRFRRRQVHGFGPTAVWGETRAGAPAADKNICVYCSSKTMFTCNHCSHSDYCSFDAIIIPIITDRLG